MGLLDGLIKGRLDKFLRGGGTSAAAIWVTDFLSGLAKQHGIELDATQKTALVGIVGGAIVWLSNRLKHQFPSGVGKWL